MEIKLKRTQVTAVAERTALSEQMIQTGTSLTKPWNKYKKQKQESKKKKYNGSIKKNRKKGRRIILKKSLPDPLKERLDVYDRIIKMQEDT